MNRATLLTSLVLAIAGASVFFYKHLELGMDLVPDPNARVWRVDVSILLDGADAVEGDEAPARVELVLPESNRRQAILDEATFDDQFELTRSHDENRRLAIWTGPMSGPRKLLYSLRVHLPSASSTGDTSQISGFARIRPPEPDQEEAEPAPELVALLERLGLEAGDSPQAIIAGAFAFVVNEIELIDQASSDPLSVLTRREGTIDGKHHLLHALLIAAGLDAQLQMGVRLPTEGPTRVESFVTVRTFSRERRMHVRASGPNRFPRNFMTLSEGNRPFVKTQGIRSAQVDTIVLRESIPAEEMAAHVAPRSALIRSLSLYRLPIPTRTLLTVLLVIPLAVLVAAVFRNLVGIRTFGTFMPVLFALSLREIGLAAGLGLITTCLAIGVVGRLLLDRLRLLFVPRICLLLSLVILVVTALAQIGHALGVRDLGSGLLFPIVILAMLIERISVVTLEEGWQSAAKLLAGSMALSSLTYPIFRSPTLGHLFFGFPELILCVMSGLVLVGGYTGYRLSELWRFRSMSSPVPSLPSSPTESETGSA